MENEWIKVEDRLPIWGQGVLVFCRGFSPSSFEIAEYFDRFESQANGDNIDRYVSHWLPLKPPTE